MKSFLSNELTITLNLVEKAELSKSNNITGDWKMAVREFHRPTRPQFFRLASLHYMSAFRSKFFTNWILKRVLIAQK